MVDCAVCLDALGRLAIGPTAPRRDRASCRDGPHHPADSSLTLRNYHVYGTFLLLNSNAGYAMYSAQHPMQGTSFQEFSAVPIPDELWGLNEARLDRELMRRGLGFVVADPGRYLLLSLSRVRDYFEFWPTRDTSLLHNLGRVGSFALFLPFILYGIWLSLRAAGPGSFQGQLG